MQQQLWLTNADRAREPVGEDEAFLKSQIITYIGNKRALLPFIDQAVRRVKHQLSKARLTCLDLFSGSGVVARYLKQHSDTLIANDLEAYSRVANACYLTNEEDVDRASVERAVRELHEAAVADPSPGFLAELYAPADDDDIQPGERAFYTRRNAVYLDSVCQRIAAYEPALQPYLLGPLLAEASVHANTSGVFKGFYKDSRTGVGRFGGRAQNALSRIMADIQLQPPVLSRYRCDAQVYQRDANELVGELPEVDLAYLDPPYNQHPYGSNYFMLNLLVDYQRPPEISRVSGIPTQWNRSAFNKRPKAFDAFRRVVNQLQARFLLVSFNSEGFITKPQMIGLLEEYGDVEVMETQYNTFRGSRNLRGRAVHVTEYLYLVERR